MDFEFEHSSGDLYVVSSEQLWNALVSAYGLGMNRGKHLLLRQFDKHILSNRHELADKLLIKNSCV